MTWQERIDEELASLESARDELRLQVHLGAAEARGVWDKAEKDFEHLEGRLKVLRTASSESVGEIAATTRLLMREIHACYDRVRELIDFENPEFAPELALMLHHCDPRRAALEYLDWIEAGQFEGANLARYFPPNIVDQLAESDNPFGEVRSQSVAVLFADIVGFTHMHFGREIRVHE